MTRKLEKLSSDIISIMLTQNVQQKWYLITFFLEKSKFSFFHYWNVFVKYMYMNLMKVLSRSYYLQSGNFWKIASVTGIFHQIRMAENHVCLQPCNILSRFAFQCLYQCLREKTVSTTKKYAKTMQINFKGSTNF